MSTHENEAKTEDVILHEKRAAAQECIDSYRSKQKIPVITTLVTAVLLIIPTLMLFLSAYDSGRALLGICELIIYATLVVASNFICGAISCRSFSYYMLMMAYRAGWKDIIRRLDKIEIKVSEKTAYEADVRKIEEELSTAADLIICTANNHHNKCAQK